MNANFLRSCGLAALLALSAVADPVPAARPSVAPAVQAVQKPAPDRITSSGDEPVKKTTLPAAAKPVAPAPVVNQKPSTPTAAPAAKPAPPAELKLTDRPTAKPAAATPAPAKVTEAPARPAAATPAPAKVTEAPAKPAAATPAPAKVTEAPAKPAAATPTPAKVTEAPARPAAATPAPAKVTEAPARPAAATPAPAKVTEAPAKPAAATPAPAKVTEAPAKPAAATPAPASKAVTSAENLVFPQAKTELKRLMIGNQAGIVKVLGPNREGVSYSRGIDDKNIARFSDDACGSIFCALGISHDKLNKVAREIMINYSTLPRKEAVAFLGAIAASAHLDGDTDAKAEQFLVQVMEADKDVHARRQAVLALAVKHNVCSDTTEHVLGLFERSENLWETFPVQQYFEYHAGQVKRLAQFTRLRERIAAVKSLYTPAILEALDGSKPVTAVP